MSIFADPATSFSPLIGTAHLAGYRDLSLPSPHTDAELDTLIRLLTLPKSRIETIAIGHARDPASRAAADAFADAWAARCGKILTVVDWPESAASWLRPSTRLTTPRPDAWIMAAAPLGFAQLARRLRHSTQWDPTRTFAFASLREPRLPALAGAGVLDGLRGADADGGTWDVNGRWVTSYAPAGVRA